MILVMIIFMLGLFTFPVTLNSFTHFSSPSNFIFATYYIAHHHHRVVILWLLLVFAVAPLLPWPLLDFLLLLFLFP